MPSYYVNAKTTENGECVVHTVGCQSMPIASNRIYLGEYDSCQQAVAAARLRYSKSNGCAVCMPDCHAT